MSNSTYLARAILNHLFRTTALAQLGTVYIALGNADFTKDNVTANEVATTGGYARASVGTTDADWAAPATSGGRDVTSNAATITFPTASANWNGGNPIGFFGIYDAATAGNLLRFGALGTARTVLSGDTFQLAPGSLVIGE